MMKRKSIAFVLILAMMLSVLPTTIGNSNVVNASTEGVVDVGTDVSDDSTLEIYIEGDNVVASSGSIKKTTSKNDGIKITGTSNPEDNKSIIISGKGGSESVNVILSDLTIITTKSATYSPIALKDSANVNLMLEGNNNCLESKSQKYAALEVSTPNVITISGINGNVGSLIASCSYYDDIGSGGNAKGAGIGGTYISSGNSLNSNGPISITTGASISAISYNGAGIGGGESGVGSNITISGGHVYAEGKNNGAGIGGGYYKNGSDITITGGKVVAKASVGAGIGGAGGNGTGTTKNIEITGGIVSSSSSNGAGIGGGGASGSVENIVISGGEINAYSKNGPGIGIGSYAIATIKNIAISSGFVTANSKYQYGIGGGYGKNKVENLVITGGSVLIPTNDNGTISGFETTSTPKGIDGKYVFKVDIPIDDGIPTGNKDIVVSSAGFEYKAKTVSNAPNCEHGDDYTSAATVFLPAGDHELWVDNVSYGSITMNNVGEYDITPYKTYEADMSKTDIILPENIYANAENQFKVKNDIPKYTKENDEAYIATGFAVGNKTGNFSGVEGKFNVTITGEHTITVYYDKYINNGTDWVAQNDPETKSLKFTVKYDLSQPGWVAIDNQIKKNNDLVIYNDNNDNVIASSGGMCITSAPALTGITLIGEAKGTDGKAVIIKNSNTDINLTLKDVSITSNTKSPVKIEDGTNVKLKLEGENNLNPIVYDFAALEVNGNSSLEISGKSNQVGYLKAKSINGAAIGGNNGGENGVITILDGIDLNLKSSNGAGLGSGAKGTGGAIHIKGGNIKSYSYYGAGIGSGYGGYNSDVDISGGRIHSESTVNGAGIGSGEYGEISDIHISDGIIIGESNGEAGIGSGEKGTSSAINISGGFVTAIGDSHSSSYINYGIVSNITQIVGGSVVASGKRGDIISNVVNQNNQSVYKVSIPLGNGIDVGNQDISFFLSGNSSTQYKVKTVKSKTNGEHGSGYGYAATVYLPAGVHSISVGGKVIGSVTVNGKDNYKFDFTTSNNTSKPPNVTKIYSPNKTIYLKKGKSITLPVIASATDSKNPKLTWSSSNSKIAAVSQSGKVVAKKKGKAKITVKAENGKSITFTINVVTKDKKVKKVGVTGYKNTMKKKQVKYLKVTLNPKAATNGKITFKSSKKSIVSVDKAGKITAKKKGKAKITVKAGGKKKVIKITVK